MKRGFNVSKYMLKEIAGRLRGNITLSDTDNNFEKITPVTMQNFRIMFIYFC